MTSPPPTLPTFDVVGSERPTPAAIAAFARLLLAAVEREEQVEEARTEEADDEEVT